MTGHSIGRRSRAFRGVATTLLATMLLAGCETDWKDCELQLIKHDGSGGRISGGRAKMKYDYVDAFGGLWKVGWVKFSIIDYNFKKKREWWEIGSLIGSLIGVIGGIALSETPIGWVLVGVSAAGLAAGGKTVISGTMSPSSEDHKSAAFVRLWINGQRKFEDYWHDLAGNNDKYLQGEKKWDTYTYTPHVDLYAPVGAVAGMQVDMWGDERGIGKHGDGSDGDTTDHRNNTRCVVNMPFPKLR